MGASLLTNHLIVQKNQNPYAVTFFLVFVAASIACPISVISSSRIFFVIGLSEFRVNSWVLPNFLVGLTNSLFRAPASS